LLQPFGHDVLVALGHLDLGVAQPGRRCQVRYAEVGQLYLLDVASGTPTPLTDSRSVSHWQALGDSFSPDGKYLAYAGNDRSPAEQDVLIRDLATGEVRRIYSGGGRIYAGHWSPDSTRLTAVNWRGAVTDQVMYVLSINDGRVTQLTPDDESATYIPGPWLPDGSDVLVMSDHGRDVAGLGVLDVETGHLSWLDASDWDVEDVALSRDGRVLAWLVNVDGASQLRARNLATGEPLATPTLPMGSASQLLLTSDGRSAVMLMSTPAKPWNVLVVDLATGDLRWVTDAHPAADPVRLCRANPGSLPGPQRPPGAGLSVPAQRDCGTRASRAGNPRRPTHPGEAELLQRRIFPVPGEPRRGRHCAQRAWIERLRAGLPAGGPP
jgi:dipeptidyl aminopeptidase/acylaminoacyl peptidase